MKMDPLLREIYERYVRFGEILHNAWIDYSVQDAVIAIVESHCSSGGNANQVITTTTSPINGANRAPARIYGKDLAGIGRRAYRKDMPVSILLNSVGLFESLVSDVAKVAYLHDPARFLLPRSGSQDELDTAGDKENSKLLTILIAASTREEAIERYIEERLRGLSYGSPVDIFRKNRLRFGLNNTLAVKCSNEITRYAEIMARRNVIVHNLGRVDSKYIREVQGTTLSAGDKVVVDGPYLFDALHVLDILAVNFANEVALTTVHSPLPLSRTRHGVITT